MKKPSIKIFKDVLKYLSLIWRGHRIGIKTNHRWSNRWCHQVIEARRPDIVFMKKEKKRS